MKQILRITSLTTLSTLSLLSGCNAILGNESPDNLKDQNLGGGSNDTTTGGGSSNTSSSGDGDDGDSSAGDSGDGSDGDTNDFTTGDGGSSLAVGGSSSGHGNSTSGDGDLTTDQPDSPCFDDDPDTACGDWTNCAPGTYVESDGTHDQDRVCGACDPGYFSDNVNAGVCSKCPDQTYTSDFGSDHCQDWTVCGWEEEVESKGTSTKDQICTDGSIYRVIDTNVADSARTVTVDPDDNVYHVTYGKVDPSTDTTYSAYQIYVTKYDTNGELLWQKRYGDKKNTSVPYAADTDSEGNLFVTGYTSGDWEGGTSTGKSDGFLAKIEPNGELSWVDTFGMASRYTYAPGITVDNKDAVYVAGYTNGALGKEGNQGGYDMIARKYSTTGTVAWTHQFGDRTEDYAHSIQVNDSGIVYLLGQATASNKPDFYGTKVKGRSDIALLIFDPDDKKIVPIAELYSSSYRGYGREIRLTDNGDAIIAGYLRNNSSYYLYTHRVTSSGIPVWSAPLTSSANSTTLAEAMVLGAAGNPTLIGYTSVSPTFGGEPNLGGSGALIRKISSEKANLWTRIYNSEDDGNNTFYDDRCYDGAVDSKGRLFLSCTSTGTFIGDGPAVGKQQAVLIMVDMPSIDAAEAPAD